MLQAIFKHNIFFKKKILFILFVDRVEGKERERERNISVRLLLICPILGTCAPYMCPDWVSNWQPFGSQAGAQSTEPHQPGLNITSFILPSFPQKYFVGLTLSPDFEASYVFIRDS